MAGLPSVPCAPYIRPAGGTYAWRGSAVLHVLSPGKHRPHLYSWHPTWASSSPLHLSLLPSWADVPGRRETTLPSPCRFLLAMAGISLISFGNEALSSLNPTVIYWPWLPQSYGPVWPHHKKIAHWATALSRVPEGLFTEFIYGAGSGLFMTFTRHWLSIGHEKYPESLFLGLGASALCFVTWNTGVKDTGPL